MQLLHYREGERAILGLESRYDPIEADTLTTRARFTLADRLRLRLDYTQDTWSGATPVATAPAELRGNFSNDLDGISNASPYLQPGRTTYLDIATLRPLATDGYGNLTGGFDDRLVHTLSGASPETRRQADLLLTYEWDESALDVGGGTSRERDYESVFGSLGGRFDFDQKRTTLRVGGSFTRSETQARLDHDALPYLYDAVEVVRDERRDVGLHASLSRELNRGARLEANVGFGHASGYLANPYKAVQVLFIDPDAQAFAPPGTYYTVSNALRERRPRSREQGSLDLRYVQHVAATDAALHLGYRYFRDDWGIGAHTFEAEWVQPLGRSWRIAPRVRFYSQSAADFYAPYLVTRQAPFPPVVDPLRGQVYVNANSPEDGLRYFDDPTLANPDGYNPNTGDPVVDENGDPVPQSIADLLTPLTTRLDPNKLPAKYSSDHRLSGYGAISAGVTLTRELGDGVALELGYEHYTHAGALKLGGGGEKGFADFRFDLLSARLNVAFGASGRVFATPSAAEDEAHAQHEGHAAERHAHAGAPAGVMFDHLLSTQGEVMVGYRYTFARRAGGMRQGSRALSAASAKAEGCAGAPCLILPEAMDMHMHMLELMWAPTDWLTLMVMPQLTDMSMRLRGVATDAELIALPHELNGLYQHHISHEHETGGFGDTSVAALVRLFDGERHHLHAGLGVSAPTGEENVQLRDTHAIDAGATHYGMQLGSGTWDFEPSLTYTGRAERFTWGAQWNATVRLRDHNAAGYGLGDATQLSAWGAYDVTHWLTGSLRVVYGWQGSIRGAYRGTFYAFGPHDEPRNHGGQLWDLGIGLSAALPGTAFKAHRVRLEWLQPIAEDLNGTQLDRKGELALSWSLSF